MDTDESAKRVERYRDQDQLRTSNSVVVFLGWIAASLVVFGVVVALASDQQPYGCESGDWCFSDRELLLFLGWMFGFYILLAQLILGLAVTALLNRLKMSSFATGTTGFFTTATGIALVLAYLALGSR
ncbi:MAG TPA: hypothetical protein VGD15_03915 [Kribbella sp.]